MRSGEGRGNVRTDARQNGGGEFEGIGDYEGGRFLGKEHFRRLQRSAELLGYTLPWLVDDLQAAAERREQRGHVGRHHGARSFGVGELHEGTHRRRVLAAVCRQRQLRAQGGTSATKLVTQLATNTRELLSELLNDLVSCYK